MPITQPTLLRILRNYTKTVSTLEKLREFDNSVHKITNLKYAELEGKVFPLDEGDTVSFVCDGETLTGEIVEMFTVQGKGVMYEVKSGREYFECLPEELSLPKRQLKSDHRDFRKFSIKADKFQAEQVKTVAAIGKRLKAMHAKNEKRFGKKKWNKIMGNKGDEEK